MTFDMTEEKKKPNWAHIGLVACIFVYFGAMTKHEWETNSELKLLKDYVAEQNHKADSIYARQELYVKAIEKLKAEINDGQMVVREIEREKPKIYNNYINQVSEYKPDSTIEKYYAPTAMKFDSLLINGFFFKP